jgi:beta-glucosidase
MREIYIKPWEVCVKDGGTMGIMTSLNKIGPYWAGGSYELLTEILRNEWGFNGNVVTDSYSGSWSHGDMMVRAGGNLALGSGSLSWGTSSASAVQALRNASQGILYSHANSMAMNTGKTPTKPRPLTGFDTTTLSTGVVDIEYKGSVATAHINTDAYPDASTADIVYTLKEGSVLPAGLVLNPDGSITGAPLEEIPYANFTVVASFKGDSREATFSMSIINASGSIVYAPLSTIVGNAGVNMEYSASVADASIVKPDATQEEIDKFPEVVYSLADGSALPRGLKLSSDGTISGTPTVECDGYEFTIVASALGYKDRYATYSISILNDIVFEASDLDVGQFGEDYLVNIDTAECNNEVTYSLKSGSELPKGLVLTAGGYIVGKPLEVVTDYEFTVIASAAYAEPVEATFKITIGIVFNSGINLAYGEENAEYVGVVSATGSSGIKYSLKEGSTLPEGLTLSERGEILGTPTKAGIYKFTILANAEGKVGDEIELTLYVANAPVVVEEQSSFEKLVDKVIPKGKKEE